MGSHNTWETLPWITGGSPTYSYTNEFQELVPSIGARAEANLSFDSAISQSYKNPAIIGQLEAMIAAAKASEQNFLSKYNLNKGNLNDWSNLVKSFNKFLGNEESFRRNLQLLKQTEDPLSGRKGTYTQLETFFSSYVQKVARRKLSHVNFNNFVLDLCKYKLFRNFKYLQIPSIYEKFINQYDDNSFAFFNTLLNELLKLNDKLKWETLPKPLVESTLLNLCSEA